MEEELYGLYDRQIRLFGKGTQRLIEEARAAVIQGAPYVLGEGKRSSDIGGEILKNLVLLGVGEVTVNRHVITSFKRMFVNEISKINEKIKVVVVDDEKAFKAWCEYALVIFIDHKEQSVSTSIYVCSKCMAFHPLGKSHLCKEYGNISAAHDCLLGAIIVQEWVKKLQGKPFVSEYQLKV
ncbi:Myb-like protein [Encephalitozoon hellem]|uniref:Myb-like protein n=1 Tax=Encephalitozoon hellem TaxID=27973 RepID=A0ABY8CJW4_ENCHE|nr:Myb-like protein [Encephalitozoon hellem]